MQARVAALNEKASMDGEDVEQWAQFVIDEGIRCKDEEKAYETRLCEREEELLCLDEVINLFETRFVDLNEYINSKARMEGDDIVGVEQ